MVASYCYGCVDPVLERVNLTSAAGKGKLCHECCKMHRFVFA